MKWIMVEDKLPENHKKIIVTDGRKMGVAYRDGKDFVGFDENCHIIPSHWMCLPEFPNQPDSSKREDHNWLKTVIIDELFDDHGKLKVDAVLGTQ